eukprot:TRINITY_DN4335_c0_g1_i1.p1 TRINITY_DN4335_c0_g1~~TRINITY_DN4335_c0_g1_i1.p1  ORF type:complete len:845 (+),score=243.93 TRINITY_DN4335_c0_g1_i1:170-2704(+)
MDLSAQPAEGVPDPLPEASNAEPAAEGMLSRQPESGDTALHSAAEAAEAAEPPCDATTAGSPAAQDDEGGGEPHPTPTPPQDTPEAGVGGGGGVDVQQESPSTAPSPGESGEAPLPSPSEQSAESDPGGNGGSEAGGEGNGDDGPSASSPSFHGSFSLTVDRAPEESVESPLSGERRSMHHHHHHDPLQRESFGGSSSSGSALSASGSPLQKQPALGIPVNGFKRTETWSDSCVVTPEVRCLGGAEADGRMPGGGELSDKQGGVPASIEHTTSEAGDEEEEEEGARGADRSSLGGGDSGAGGDASGDASSRQGATSPVSQMDGVMLLLNGLKQSKGSHHGAGVGVDQGSFRIAALTAQETLPSDGLDWKAICQGCGMVGHCNTEVDDMVWFVTEKGKAVVRRRTEQDTWLDRHPGIDWERTLYLNVIANWKFELTVAVINTEDHIAAEWTTRRVYASPQRVKEAGGSKDLREIEYVDTYPDIYFNIEDYSDAFGDMRLALGQSWALEVSALSSAGKRVQVVKGKLSYEKLVKKFQLTTCGARLGQEEVIEVKAPRNEGWLQLTVNIAPEEVSNVPSDPEPPSSSNPFMKIAYRAAYKAQQKFEGKGDKIFAAPSMQCYLKHVTATESHIIRKILQLQHENHGEWIKIPTSASSTVSTANLHNNNSLISASPTTYSGAGSRDDVGAVNAEIAYAPQTVALEAPADTTLRVLWEKCFGPKPPLFVDVVMGSAFHGWIAKRGGKRIFATQAYHQRMVVVTSKGLLHYYSDASPNSEAKGTCYLRGARLKRRQRSSASASNAHVLEVHPTTPRRPGATTDPIFHFGFNTAEDLESFAKQIIPFAVMPP